MGIVLLGVTSAHADVELTGIMVTADSTLFTLVDTGTNKGSEWLKMGDTYDGYTLDAFDREKEVLDVRLGGAIRQLQIRVSKVDRDNKGLLSTKPIDWDKRRIERFGSLGELILADIRSDASYTYITPREVWKGSAYMAGKTFAIRNSMLFDGLRTNGVATIILALPSEEPFAAGSPLMAAGTDGLRMGGPKGILLDSFRDYYRPAEKPAPSPR